MEGDLMTAKQCNSCKWHIYVKELEEQCYLLRNEFFKNKNCSSYKTGLINQGHKESFKKLGSKYPFTEIR